MFKKILIGVVVLVILAGAAFAYVHFHRAAPLVQTPAQNPAATSDTTVPIVTEDGVLYSNPQYHFSVRYPKEIGEVAVYDKDDTGGRTIVFTDNDTNRSFQIYIVPYAGNTITKAQFLNDDPSGVMQQPTDILVDGIHATMFFGSSDTVGDTREVWFINGGFLYEVTTYKQLDSWLAGIMQTWQFI